jgi:hypothetical protein
MLRALKRLIQGDDKLWLAAAKIFVGNGNGEASAVAPAGDLTVDSAGSFAIGASKITGAMIAANAVSAAKIIDACVSTAKLAASAATAAKVAYTAVSITVVASAASTTSCYAVVAITSGAKLLGLWLTTEVSDAVSFTWACNVGTNSIKVDITEGQGLNTLVWKGVVIEP